MKSLGLRPRILLTLLVPLALFAPVTVTIVFNAVSSAISAQADARGAALAQQIAAMTVDDLLTGQRFAAERLMQDVVTTQPDVEYAFAIAEDHRVLAHTFKEGFPSDLLLAHTTPRAERPSLVVRIGEREVHDVMAPVVGGLAGHVHVGISTGRATALSRDLLMRLSLIGVGVVLTGVAVTLALSSRVLRRLRRLSDAAEAVGKGNLRARVADVSGDEIGRLSNAFDAMAERLDAARAEREKTFQRLAQSEKLWAVGRLASGVAHEINNPLSGVVHCVESLQKNDRDEAKRRKYYDLVTDGVVRAQRVVRQLLEYSKQHELQPADVDLGVLLARVLELLAPSFEKSAVRLVFDDAPSLPLVRADAHAIEQVFLNLVLNAIDAMPEGGELRVGIEQRGELVVVTVQDEGVGIAPESLGRIFDPFFTTKAGSSGSGLGLSVSMGIVERHGGTIQVESTPGEGAAFEVLLPLSGLGGIEGPTEPE
ncbi:MAG: HAMP domain-containing protein [Myxococcales bacterium]|nr:HAMP domain-containing protein [Myxococcales bacterium]